MYVENIYITYTHSIYPAPAKAKKQRLAAEVKPTARGLEGSSGWWLGWSILGSRGEWLGD